MIRRLLGHLFRRDRDEAFDDFRRRLASHRANVARREHSVVARTRLLETGHYLGDRAGRRVGDVAREPAKRPDRPVIGGNYSDA